MEFYNLTFKIVLDTEDLKTHAKKKCERNNGSRKLYKRTELKAKSRKEYNSDNN